MENGQDFFLFLFDRSTKEGIQFVSYSAERNNVSVVIFGRFFLFGQKIESKNVKTSLSSQYF